MEEIQENLAEYNKALNFIVKFKAPSSRRGLLLI